MLFTIDKSDAEEGACKLHFDKEATIYVAETLKEELSIIIDDYEKFELDLRDVEEIDSAGVQLLVALRLELARRQKTLKISDISNAVRKILSSYCLSHEFGVSE